MKVPALLLLFVGASICSLEPLDYRRPSKFFLPPTFTSPSSDDYFPVPNDSGDYGLRLVPRSFDRLIRDIEPLPSTTDNQHTPDFAQKINVQSEVIRVLPSSANEAPLFVGKNHQHSFHRQNQESRLPEVVDSREDPANELPYPKYDPTIPSAVLVAPAYRVMDNQHHYHIHQNQEMHRPEVVNANAQELSNPEHGLSLPSVAFRAPVHNVMENQHYYHIIQNQEIAADAHRVPVQELSSSERGSTLPPDTFVAPVNNVTDNEQDYRLRQNQEMSQPKVKDAHLTNALNRTSVSSAALAIPAQNGTDRQHNYHHHQNQEMSQPEVVEASRTVALNKTSLPSAAFAAPVHNETDRQQNYHIRKNQESRQPKVMDARRAPTNDLSSPEGPSLPSAALAAPVHDVIDHENHLQHHEADHLYHHQHQKVEQSSGESARSSFSYAVKDESSGNDFGHEESRDGDVTRGKYHVLLPDGRRQVVEYEADERGYRPRISYEPATAARAYPGAPH